jgi:hypothetical protein
MATSTISMQQRQKDYSPTIITTTSNTKAMTTYNQVAITHNHNTTTIKWTNNNINNNKIM